MQKEDKLTGFEHVEIILKMEVFELEDSGW